MSLISKILAVGLALSVAAPVAAMEKISSQDEFLNTLDGQTLFTRYLGVGISVAVFPDGNIAGSALGSDITGDWAWQDGYFCREMTWGSRPIPYNCQLVEFDGTEMRFTTDRGDGRYADFDLR